MIFHLSRNPGSIGDDEKNLLYIILSLPSVGEEFLNCYFSSAIKNRKKVLKIPETGMEIY
jgi:hypothetical protein